MREQRVVRRLSALLAAVAICLSAVSVLEVTPAGASQYSVDSWNMAAGNRDYNNVPNQEQAASNVVYGHAVSGHPWVMALTEICGYRAMELSAALQGVFAADQNYDSSVANTQFCDFPTGGQGNLELAIGPKINTFSVELQYDHLIDEHHRFLTCTTRQNIGFAYIACSTHISNEPALSGVQAVTAANNVSGWNGTGLYTIVGGDYNLTPNIYAMQVWQGFNREAHNMSWCNTHPPNGAKYDYIFVSVSHGSQTVGGSCSQMVTPVSGSLPLSDHQYIWGFFTIY